MVFYMDASALAKRYLNEGGSGWVRTLADPPQRNRIITAAITRVELAAAIAARHRAPPPTQISLTDRNQMLALIARHFVAEYISIAIGGRILDHATELVQHYRLRGYDAVQLATAIVANRALATAGEPPLIVVAADHDFLAAATAEGFSVENPAHH